MARRDSYAGAGRDCGAGGWSNVAARQNALAGLLGPVTTGYGLREAFMPPRLATIIAAMAVGIAAAVLPVEAQTSATEAEAVDLTSLLPKGARRTVIRGVDSAEAVASFGYTRNALSAWCRAPTLTFNGDCQTVFSSPRVIRANCATGAFSDFSGDELAFEGRPDGSDEFYRHALLFYGEASGEPLYGDTEYKVAVSIFSTLCPEAVAKALAASSDAASSIEGPVVGGAIAYGSRTGQELTITGVRGIDSDSAVIEVEHTRANAKAFCVQYRLDESDGCVDEALKDSKFAPSVRADCTTMGFFTASGTRYTFTGRSKSTAAEHAYRIINWDTNKEPQTSGEYIVAEQTFAALCPARFAEHGGASVHDSGVDTPQQQPSREAIAPKTRAAMDFAGGSTMICIHSYFDAIPPGSRATARGLAMGRTAIFEPEHRSFFYDGSGELTLNGQSLEVVGTQGDAVAARLPTTVEVGRLPNTFTDQQQRAWQALQQYQNSQGQQAAQSLGLDRRIYVLNFKSRQGIIATNSPSGVTEQQPMICR